LRLVRKHNIQEIKNKKIINEKIKEIQNFEIQNIQEDDEFKNLDEELETAEIKLKTKKTIEKEIKTKVSYLINYG